MIKRVTDRATRMSGCSGGIHVLASVKERNKQYERRLEGTKNEQDRNIYFEIPLKGVREY